MVLCGGKGFVSPTMDLVSLFGSISTKMRADFDEARTAFTHPGLKGTAFENTVKSFLKAYLPEKLSVCSGQLIDAEGRISKQLDIIVYDAHGTPILKESGDVRVLPVECAYSIIEVKAHLSTPELDGAYANMRSVRALRKTAFPPQVGAVTTVKLLYGAEWVFWPVNYFVFAFDSIDPFTLCRRHRELHQDAALHERIDLVCILDKGVILHTDDSKSEILPLPEVGCRIGFKKTDHALLLFYALVSQVLNQASMPPFRFAAYLKNTPI